MKNIGFVCIGAVIMLTFALILGFTPTGSEGRYQLFFGKVIQLGVDPNYGSELPVCFRLDTQTGETRIYANVRILEGTGMIGRGDMWKTVIIGPSDAPKSPEAFVLDSNKPNKP